MDDTKSRAFRSRLTTILRALPCTRARVTRDRVTSPHPHPHPARHTGNSKLEKILVVLLLRWPCICLRCLLKIHPEPDLITALHGFNASGYGFRHGRLVLGRDASVPAPPIARARAGVSREPARSRRAGPRTRAPPTVFKTTAAVIKMLNHMTIIAGGGKR